MLGAVMAGGRALRLGVDKALTMVGGQPLWQRQVTVLEQAGASRVVLIRRPEQTSPPGIECWRDTVADAGPMAGLRTALAPLLADWVAVLAVDMPGIDAAWFLRLREVCRLGTGAMVQHAEACEPLAAIYPREALAEVETRLQQHDLSLQRLAAALRSRGLMTLVPARAEDLIALRSINTRADLEFWQAAKTSASVR